MGPGRLAAPAHAGWAIWRQITQLGRPEWAIRRRTTRGDAQAERKWTTCDSKANRDREIRQTNLPNRSIRKGDPSDESSQAPRGLPTPAGRARGVSGPPVAWQSGSGRGPEGGNAWSADGQAHYPAVGLDALQDVLQAREERRELATTALAPVLGHRVLRLGLRVLSSAVHAFRPSGSRSAMSWAELLGPGRLAAPAHAGWAIWRRITQLGTPEWAVRSQSNIPGRAPEIVAPLEREQR